MSAYTENKTTFTDAEMLAQCLREQGYERVEIHSQAVTLYDWHGQPRPQTAEVVIRRKYIDSLANDIGFKRQADGTFAVIISEYDSGKQNEKWMAQVKTRYITHGARKIAAKKGLRFLGQTEVNGKVKLRFEQLAK